MKKEELEFYMGRCLELAKAGSGMVAPNPMVGALVVKDGVVIAEGFHRVFGGPHAEVDALQHLDESIDLSDATLFVNLEPCSHHGKTPPCADLIIRRKVGRVVTGMRDPFELVAGSGIEKLKAAGIEVIEDILRNECRKINRRFITFHEKKRPYILLKWAQSADGFLDKERGEGEKGVNWISGPESKRRAHAWRAEETAILVGSSTVITDNPLLTVRDVQGKNPVRIVLDKSLRLTGDEHVFNADAPSLWINGSESRRVNENLEMVKLDSHDLHALMHLLYERRILSVMVEGGAQVLQSFIQPGLWDEARVITGNVSWKKGLAAPVIGQEPAYQEASGEDRIEYFFHTSDPA